MKKTRFTISILAVLLLFVAGCSSSGEPSQNSKDLREAARERAQNRIVSADYYSLPSPMEIANLVQASGVECNLQLLHKAELGVRYSTNRAAAINLGIYSADLSYCIYFNQLQEALKYLDCVKELGSTLDVADSLTQSKLKELEDNIQNKEMLKKIVSRTFFHSDALLKMNGRNSTASMVAMGMWIESLYISTQLTGGSPDANKTLTKTVIEQGMVFEDLLGMIGTAGASSSDIECLKTDFQPLKVSYLNIKKGLGDSYICNAETDVDASLFKDLCKTVKDVRDSFTKLF